MSITITPQDLARVQSRASLFAFLHQTLGWPLNPADTFTYDAPLLNGAAPRVQVSRLLPFGANDPFLILLAEWETPLRRTDLREILRTIRARIRRQGAYGSRNIEEIVFVCPAQDYHAVWFAHFEEREGRQPRLEVFGWEADRIAATRTLREVNLPALAMPALNLRDEPDWTAGRLQWLSAWDVEAVTRAFFRDYKEVFHGVRDALPTEFTGDRMLWTQRLLNRLLFIHFLSQKREGWLRFHDRWDYLQALWEGWDTSANFYCSRLRPLFFTALNHHHVRSLREDNPPLHALIGDVPYLNGGLFEKADDDDAILEVPNPALEKVLALFGRYRFTITESTPDDVEVAVDPEMLGKVFEELVTGRHESGSYYTPRPVVTFMCREALKGYLDGQTALVDGRSADSLTRKEAVILLQKLATVHVVDPACGSGAYLLGMLHELYELTGLLELRADPLSARGQYQRKLTIIQNALYGVDLDPFAVNVARLRLWLSLAVEFEGDTPEPLPNLDFKVECGDSLAGPLPQQDLTGDIFRQAQIDDYKAIKREYGSPYFKGNRKELLKRVDDLKHEIAAWAHPDHDPKQPTLGFDWQVEFAEVFTSSEPVTEPAASGGFDIVVMNPPYLSAGRIPGDQKEAFTAYMDRLKSQYQFKNDLYIHFFYRAFDLLKSGGTLCAITSNTFLTNPSKEFVRQMLLKNTLQWLIPVSKEVFNADVYSAITIVQKAPPQPQSVVNFLNFRKQEVASIAQAASQLFAATRIPQREYEKALATLFFEPTEANRKIFSMLRIAQSLNEGDLMKEGQKYVTLARIAPALDTGIHSGNVRLKLFFHDQPVGKNLAKLIQGSQVIRYGSWWSAPHARYRYVDVSYIPDEEKRGVGRGGKESAGKEYWHFCGSADNHQVTERLLMRQTEDEPFVGYIFQGKEEIYTDNTVFTLLLTEAGNRLGFSYRSLMAILNSESFRRIYHALAQEEGRTLAQVKTSIVNSLPIPVLDQETKHSLEDFVMQIQGVYQNSGLPLPEAAAKEVQQTQRTIDDVVARLYNL